jgi:hypothetical protein
VVEHIGVIQVHNPTGAEGGSVRVLPTIIKGTRDEDDWATAWIFCARAWGYAGPIWVSPRTRPTSGAGRAGQAEFLRENRILHWTVSPHQTTANQHEARVRDGRRAARSRG